MEEPVEYNAGKKGEQRIWIEFDIPKPKGAIDATRCITMTRAEAIEKIDYVLQDFGIRKNDLEIAEAALDALLGESK
jgi:hypothetical protein